LGRNIDSLKTPYNIVDGYDFPVMINAMEADVKNKYNKLYTHTDWNIIKDQKYDTIFCSLVLQHMSYSILDLYLSNFVKMAPKLFVITRWYIDDNYMLIMPLLEKYYKIQDIFIYYDHSKILSLTHAPENQCHFETILLIS
jgi:hypothetical protein